MSYLQPSFDQPGSFNLTGQILFGIVVNNNDPLEQQRLVIRISLLHQGYKDGDLPWVLPISSLTQGSAPGIGSVNVPVTGSRVAVYFPENDVVNTYWLGSSTVSTSVLSDFSQNYPNAYGNVDSAGNLFKVDTVAGTWTWNMVDGSIIQFDKGTINIVATQALNINIEGPANINVSGTANISAGGNLNLFGSTINLNTGSAPSPSPNPVPRQKPPVTTFNNQTNY